jgi:toxin-antitoxin system PIN domain toxin
VIVLDANLLLYAYSSASSRHQEAREWVSKIFSGDELVGLPWQTVHAFLRIATDTRISSDRFSTAAALAVVKQWMELPQVRMLAPGERHWFLLQQMLIEGQAKGPLIFDAQLAAITVEYGGVLYSTDRDFARFPGLRWINPLG